MFALLVNPASGAIRGWAAPKIRMNIRSLAMWLVNFNNSVAIITA